MNQSGPLLRPMPVKRLTAAAVLMVVACIGDYLLTPKWQAVRQEQTRLADPLHTFSDENVQEEQLFLLQSQICANPRDGVKWAQLGGYYLWQNAYHNALLAYEQVLRVGGENAEVYSAMATVLYYQAGQRMTPPAREMTDKALALDLAEVTALMLLASDASTHADYTQAVSAWQKVMDLNSSRVNRTQLVDSIDMAKLLQNRQK